MQHFLAIGQWVADSGDLILKKNNQKKTEEPYNVNALWALTMQSKLLLVNVMLLL